MEIREEYKQLDAKLKRNDDRSRKLDLISVCVFKEAKKSRIAIEAYVYNETGQKLSDSADNIFSLFKEIREFEHIEKDITDFSKEWDWDKFMSFENDIDEINYFIFCNLDFIIGYFKHISETHKSSTLLGGQIDSSIIERIEWSLKQGEVLLSALNNALVNSEAITFDLIKKYQLAFRRKEKESDFEYFYDEFIEIKQSRGLSDAEYEQYLKELSENFYYLEVLVIILHLVNYLLFLDDEPRHAQLVIKTINRWVPIIESMPEADIPSISSSNHTLDDIFNLLIKYPRIVIKNLFMYIKNSGHIDMFQYSAILDAIKGSDLNLFRSSINNELALFFDSFYFLFELMHSYFLKINSNTIEESKLAELYDRNLLAKYILIVPAHKYNISDLEERSRDLDKSSIPPQIVEKFINNVSIILGFITYFYKQHRSDIYPGDQKYFDRIFTQEPYKEYCEKSLLELEKQYPNDKSFSAFLRFFYSLLGLECQRQKSTDKDLIDIKEEVVVSEPSPELDAKPQLAPNSEKIVNPFGGLNPDALRVCGNDKRGYISLFIDYLIYRGYINSENKDTFVCSMCDEMVHESTLDNLSYNETNTEGKSNKNVVTLLFGRLTRYTAKNGIDINGKVISGGSIYFNKRQVDNGELQEWCLFWPFLKEKIKRGKGSLFQNSDTIPKSDIDKMLDKVGKFIKEFEETKGSTKLDFIKKKHSLP